MKAVLVEVLQRRSNSKIKELEELAESSGYQVVRKVVQKRRPDPTYLMGKGKVREIKEIIDQHDANTIIFANTLKASQAFRIRKELGWKVNVIDRNILILEIFEERARTAEAKLQIELARLYYTLPWTREYLRFKNIYGEQVGWGALGEYLHKIYEQHIKRRTTMIERRLDKIRKKSTERINKRHEGGFPEVILTGYTQAGKTELFNKLTNEKKPTGLGPFTTLSTYARRVEVDRERRFILIDSIGFIEEMHPRILEAFYATLHELSLSDLIILVIDVSEEEKELKKKINASEEMLRKVAPATPILIALNKIDIVDEKRIMEAIKMTEKSFPYQEIITISAKKETNIKRLLNSVIETLERERRWVNPKIA